MDSQSKKILFASMETILKQVFGERLECGAFDMDKQGMVGYNFWVGCLAGEITYIMSKHDYVVKILDPQKKEISYRSMLPRIALSRALDEYLRRMVRELAFISEVVDRVYERAYEKRTK